MPQKSKKYSRSEIHALALQEFQGGRSADQAQRNICRDARGKIVIRATVDRWFRKFECGDFSLHTAEQKPIKPDVNLYANKSNLFEVSDVRLSKGFKTVDGRLGFMLFYEDNQRHLFVVDLFYGTIRKVESADTTVSLDGYSRLEILDNSHLLLFGTTYVENNLRLVFINYNTLKFEVLDQISLVEPIREILVDSSKPANFACVVHGCVKFGRVQDNQISTDPVIVPIPRMHCTRLVNGILSGLLVHENEFGYAFVESCQYCEYSANGELLYSVNIPMLLGELKLFVPFNHVEYMYSWYHNHLYLASWLDSCDFILHLDIDTGLWSKVVKNMVKDVQSVFVDHKGCATLFCQNHLNDKQFSVRDPYVVRRLPLRRPDSLRNNAWMTLHYHKRFSKSTLFDKISNRLPYNTELRSKFFPSE